MPSSFFTVCSSISDCDQAPRMIPTLSGRSEMDKPGAVQEARSSEGSATGRQLSIAFEAAPLHGISSPDRAKVLIHLASLLLQALGQIDQ